MKTLASIVLAVMMLMSGQHNVPTSTGATAVAPVPPTPVAGMSFWYSADCITFVSSVCGTPSNGTTNFTWADRSGNANNAAYSQGTCTFNTNQVNSLPAVTFSSCKFTFSSIAATFGHTMFAVLKTISSGGTGGPYILGAGNSSGIGWTAPSVNGAQTIANVGVSNPVIGTDFLSSGVWTQINATVSNSTPASSGMRVSSATDTLVSNTSTTWGSPGPSCIGAYCNGTTSNFISGQVAEIIYYNSALTLTQIQQNEAYFRFKYGIS